MQHDVILPVGHPSCCWLDHFSQRSHHGAHYQELVCTYAISIKGQWALLRYTVLTIALQRGYIALSMDMVITYPNNRNGRRVERLGRRGEGRKGVYEIVLKCGSAELCT